MPVSLIAIGFAAALAFGAMALVQMMFHRAIGKRIGFFRLPHRSR